MTSGQGRARDVGWWRSWRRSLVLSVFEHLPLIGLLGLSWASYWLVKSFYLGPQLELSWSGFRTTVVIAAAAILGVTAGYTSIWALRRARSDRLDCAGWSEFLGDRVSKRRIVGTFVVLLWWLVFVRLFDTLKAYIPVVFPFHWDRLFMEIDRVLHGGVHPWELVHGLFGGHFATVVIDEIYFSWYFIVLVMLVWAAWSGNREARLRFFIALSTVQFGLGNVMALVGSSAGPIYYDRIVSNLPPAGGPYTRLVEHLESVDASASLHMWSIQQGLWAHYQALPDSETGSIAAMPSIHVAVVVLFALALRDTHWVLSGLMWIYAGMTLVGSVYLGWHYAIDGYAAILAVLLIWIAVGWFTDSYWMRFMKPFEDRFK